MNNSKTIRAWHFSNGALRFAYDDDANLIHRLIVTGSTFACEPDKIALCEYGFHASVDIRDAFSYAPTDTTHISLVQLGGRIIEDTDKHVASIRRHLVVADCGRTLHEFAIWCAEQALALISDPDPRSIEALAVKRRWLDGKVTDEKLAAARAAARAAVWAAVWAAAWDAAWDAQSKKLEDMVLALPEFQEATVQ